MAEMVKQSFLELLIQGEGDTFTVWETLQAKPSFTAGCFIISIRRQDTAYNTEII